MITKSLSGFSVQWWDLKFIERITISFMEAGFSVQWWDLKYRNRRNAFFPGNVLVSNDGI